MYNQVLVSIFFEMTTKKDTGLIEIRISPIAEIVSDMDAEFAMLE
jgi:hypothetical protein